MAKRNIFAMDQSSGAGKVSSIRLVPMVPDDAKNCLGLPLGDKLRQRWPVLVAVDGLIRCPSHSIVAEITFTTSRIRPCSRSMTGYEPVGMRLELSEDQADKQGVVTLINSRRQAEALACL
ncbi:MAG: hypothetical protein EKK31_04400 [Hyphomicrobiales bacterium]|nr:MAG: hypothetical protein EKK31_04400 [Hyphomicrobiales bacterium]